MTLAFAAFVFGVILGAILVLRPWTVRLGHRSARDLPPDPNLMLGFLRQAHDAVAACVIFKDEEEVLSADDRGVEAESISRLLATARLAMADSGRHVFQGDETVVAFGDGDCAAGLTLARRVASTVVIESATSDLRRFVASLNSQRSIEASPTGQRTLVGTESVTSLAAMLCEAARSISRRPCALAMVDKASGTPSIVAVSEGADRRLVNTLVESDSAVARVCITGTAVVAETAAELFGTVHENRRRGHDRGTVSPIRSGIEVIGALVIFGRPGELDREQAHGLQRLASEMGPKLAVALAVRAAEKRAMTDDLTGLPNRRALERVMSGSAYCTASLVCVDVDYFKRINDTYGHLAGDSALKHIARLLHETLREGDMPARVGGEEFAMWLPDTPLCEAVDVAERVRIAMAKSVLHWQGNELQLTCSLGVSSYPETVTQIENLIPTADAALYRAKKGGRNRVEFAKPAH